MNIIRSIIFYPGYISIVILWALSMVLIALWMPLKKRTYVCYIFAKIYEIWLFLSCNIRVYYKYEAPLPQQENYVIMANHQSSWEAYAVTVLRRPSVTVLKEELIRIPFFGQALLTIKPIIVQRRNLVQSMKRIYTQGIERLNEGFNFVIFPQGTRYGPNNMGLDKFNPSAVNLSFASGIPLLLVAHNSGHCLPPHRFIKYPGIINVLIGKPLNPHGHTKTSFYKLVMKDMARMLKQVHSK